MKNRNQQQVAKDDEQEIVEDVKRRALTFLVDKRNMHLNEAVAELSNLTAGQTMLLMDFHRDGLRADMIRDANIKELCDVYAQFRTQKSYSQTRLFGLNVPDSRHRDAIQTFSRLFRGDISKGRSISTALQHINILAVFLTFTHATESRFLKRHINLNIRPEEIRTLYSSPEAIKTYYFLRILHHLRIKTALSQLDGLTPRQMIFLRKHYHSGVRNEHLIGYTNHCMDDVEFAMQMFGLSAVDAMAELSELSQHQMAYLRLFATSGLTIADASQLRLSDKFNVDNKGVAAYLVREKDYDLVAAINEVQNKTDEQLVVLMLDSTRFNSMRM